MRAGTLENIEILVGAIWGATIGEVPGDHLSKYRRLMTSRETLFCNDDEPTLKQTIFLMVSTSLAKKDFCLEDLLTVPWSSHRIQLPRIAASLIAFTNDQGKKIASEYFPVDEIIAYLHCVRRQYEETGVQLGVPEQFAAALRQEDDNPVAAALLAHSAFRSVARRCDTRISESLRFPVTADKDAITMMCIAESTASFRVGQDTFDPLGDTYHYWSQFVAGMVFALVGRRAKIYRMLFKNAPELTSFFRERWRHKTQQFGTHKEIDRLGFRLGGATGNLIMNKLSQF